MNKNLKYLKYIIKHKWYVLIECWKIGLYWRGLVHDMSKLLPDEWIPYCNWFYTKNSDENKFNRAWIRHIHRNKHHWQYWVLREDDGNTLPLEIPTDYLLEMWCDWIGAGKAITGKDNMNEWYEAHKDIMIIHPNNKKWIENRIKDIYGE